MSVYCMRCGRLLDDRAYVCPDCGAPTRRGGALGDNEAAETHVTPTSAGRTDLRDLPVKPVPHAVRKETAWRPPAPRALAAAGIACALIVALGLGSVIVSGMLGTGSPAESDASQASVPTTSAAQDLGSAGIAVRDSLADYSWQELSVIAKEITRRDNRNEALTIAHEYHLTDDQGHMSRATKQVTIAGKGDVSVRLADVFHDDLANGEGTAGLTFVACDLTLTHAMKLNDDNIGGWEASQLRSWLNSEVLSLLDADLAPLVVAVDKRTNNVGNTTSTFDVTSTLDKLWIPSVVEVCGQIGWLWDSDPANSDNYNAVMGAEGFQYACFAEAGVISTEDNSALVLSGEAGAASWWLRSSSASKPAHYRLVDGAGNPSRWGSAPDELGVCLGFCL